jgi:hypothetical protein
MLIGSLAERGEVVAEQSVQHAALGPAACVAVRSRGCGARPLRHANACASRVPELDALRSFSVFFSPGGGPPAVNPTSATRARGWRRPCASDARTCVCSSRPVTRRTADCSRTPGRCSTSRTSPRSSRAAYARSSTVRRSVLQVLRAESARPGNLTHALRCDAQRSMLGPAASALAEFSSRRSVGKLILET